MKTGGVSLAKNVNELVKYVEDYLADPNKDREGRKKIIAERCWKLDGKSSERLASFLINEIHKCAP